MLQNIYSSFNGRVAKWITHLTANLVEIPSMGSIPSLGNYSKLLFYASLKDIMPTFFSGKSLFIINSGPDCEISASVAFAVLLKTCPQYFLLQHSRSSFSLPLSLPLLTLM